MKRFSSLRDGPSPGVSETSSYSSIYRALRFLGSASAVTTLLSLVRNKAFAIWLGPAGLGMLGLLQAVVSTAGNLGGCGVGYSATRMISRARGRRRMAVARAFELALEALGYRLALLTMVVTAFALYAWGLWNPEGRLSALSTGAVALAAGVSILASVANTRLQTRRAPGLLAAALILAAATHTIVAIAAAATLGDDAAAVVAAALPLSAWLAATWGLRRSDASSTRRPAIRRLRGIGTIIWRQGVALMSPGLLESACVLAIRMIAAAALGVAALGQVYAALALAGFVLGTVMTAMNQDFLPRVCEALDSRERLYQLASEQMRVSVQLAAPILLLLCAFPVETTHLLYSSAFNSTVSLLPIVSMIVVVQIATWPVHTLQTALGRPTQQLMGSVANAGVTLLLLAIFYRGISLAGFATILLTGESARFLTQHVLLRTAVGIGYGPRDYVPLALLLAPLAALAFAQGRTGGLEKPVGLALAAAWAAFAAHHYWMHRHPPVKPSDSRGRS